MLAAADYKSLIVSFKNGAPVRLSDVAQVVDSAENVKLGAWAGLKPAIILDVQRQPGANVIATVDAIKARPAGITGRFTGDAEGRGAERSHHRHPGIGRASGIELLLAVLLVVLVIFAFLRSLRATFIASVAVPISLIGTCGAMYLFGYSLNNLSLMALTIATGFVVDDAIVMIENISRYIEQGESPMEAAYKGAAQIGFTIISLTASADRGAYSAAVHGRCRGTLVSGIRDHSALIQLIYVISAVGSRSRWCTNDVRRAALKGL